MRADLHLLISGPALQWLADLALKLRQRTSGSNLQLEVPDISHLPLEGGATIGRRKGDLRIQRQD